MYQYYLFSLQQEGARIYNLCHHISTLMKALSTMDTLGALQCILLLQYHFIHSPPTVNHTECVPGLVSDHNARPYVTFMMYVHPYIEVH